MWKIFIYFNQYGSSHTALLYVKLFYRFCLLNKHNTKNTVRCDLLILFFWTENWWLFFLWHQRNITFYYGANLFLVRGRAYNIASRNCSTSPCYEEFIIQYNAEFPGRSVFLWRYSPFRALGVSLLTFINSTKLDTHTHTHTHIHTR